jgi:hypothetical protein
MLQTGKGTVSILPVDYLYWSPHSKVSFQAHAAVRSGSRDGRARRQRRGLPRSAGPSSRKPALSSVNKQAPTPNYFMMPMPGPFVW